MIDLLRQFRTSTTAGKPADGFLSLRPGATIRVHQKISADSSSATSKKSKKEAKEGAKFRIQVFEGIIIARKHGSGPEATITVRKISNGVGVERIFPLHLPTIEKFEVLKMSKVRRSKLYYLRTKSAKETRRKTKVIEAKAPATEVASE